MVQEAFKNETVYLIFCEFEIQSHITNFSKTVTRNIFQ